MIRSHIAYRRALLTRLSESADAIANARLAAADGRMPDDVAESIADAGADLATWWHRLRLARGPDAMAGVRRWADGFARAACAAATKPAGTDRTSQNLTPWPEPGSTLDADSRTRAPECAT